MATKWNKKILFILYGEHKTTKSMIAKRLERLGYIDRNSSFTELDHSKAPDAPAWKKGNGVSAVVDVTDILDPRATAEMVRKKFAPTFDVVLTLEVRNTTSLLTLTNDEFRAEVDYGISLSDSSVDEDERLQLFLNRRKKVA